jgi:hypothetical protein
MKYYHIPTNLPDWLILTPRENFGGSAERLMFKDNRTGAEISTYYDDCNALGFYGSDEFNQPLPYFEAYPINETNERFELSEELFAAVIAEFGRLITAKPEPETQTVDAETLRLALQNLYNDYATYYPSAVNNSPAMKAAAELLNLTKTD